MLQYFDMRCEVVVFFVLFTHRDGDWLLNLYKMNYKFFIMTSNFKMYPMPLTFGIRGSPCFHLLLFSGDNDTGKGYPRLEKKNPHEWSEGPKKKSI